MAGSVSTDFSFFTGASATDSSCDTVTDWSSGTVDTEIFLEGTGSIVAKVSKATAVFTYTLTANLDLTDKLVIAWMNCATPGILGTRAGGGLQIRLTDNVGNYGWWYVAGNDTYFGSWDAFVIHTAQRSGSYYVESATAPDLTNIATVGVACTTTASAAKDNFWFDAVRYGTYLEINSGTSGSPATFDDIETAELANYYGGVVFQEGVFFPQCQLRIGNTGSTNTYFEDGGKILVFRDRDFPNDFYDFRMQGGTGTTEIYLGDKVGDAGVAGIVVDAAGPGYTVTALDTDIDNVGFYGTSFYDSNEQYLPTVYSGALETRNVTYNECGEIFPSSGIMQNCTFIGAPNYALHMIEDHNISYCNFINCASGIHITASGSYDFNNLTFTGGTYHIINDAPSGVVVVNAIDSNPSTYVNLQSATTQILNSVFLTVTVLDQNTDPINLAQVAIFNASGVQLMNKDTDSFGIAQESYNYVGDTSVTIRVRKSSTGSTRYVPVSNAGLIDSDGLTTTITMVEDSIAT